MPPLPLVKVVIKKMAAAARRIDFKSFGPPDQNPRTARAQVFRIWDTLLTFEKEIHSPPNAHIF